MDETHKSSLILILLAVVFVMAVGYSAFVQSLNITGTATIDSTWDVHIENIEVANEINQGKNVSATVGDDKLSADFKATLIIPSSAVTYNITVKNSGTVDAKLNSLIFDNSLNDAIKYTYSNIAQNDVIESNQTQTFSVTVSFNDQYTTDPKEKTGSLKMILGYVQA